VEKLDRGLKRIQLETRSTTFPKPSRARRPESEFKNSELDGFLDRADAGKSEQLAKLLMLVQKPAIDKKVRYLIDTISSI
jgi:hypothetical protein